VPAGAQERPRAAETRRPAPRPVPRQPRTQERRPRWPALHRRPTSCDLEREKAGDKSEMMVRKMDEEDRMNEWWCRWVAWVTMEIRPCSRKKIGWTVE
jgi:hypothetical protein